MDSVLIFFEGIDVVVALADVVFTNAEVDFCFLRIGAMAVDRDDEIKC